RLRQGLRHERARLGPADDARQGARRRLSDRAESGGVLRAMRRRLPAPAIDPRDTWHRGRGRSRADEAHRAAREHEPRRAGRAGRAGGGAARGPSGDGRGRRVRRRAGGRPPPAAVDGQRRLRPAPRLRRARRPRTHVQHDLRRDPRVRRWQADQRGEHSSPGEGNGPSMTIKGKAYIAGAFEHPTRKADDKSVAQLHAEVAKGALEDAGLTKNDVDGYFCAGDAPGLGPLSMADYMGLKLRHVDTTDTGGSSYVIHVAHAAEAIALGKCSVPLITLAGRPRSEGQATGTAPRVLPGAVPDAAFEIPYAPATANMYAMAAMRHMHQFGTTSAQLALVKVAASLHAQHNP